MFGYITITTQYSTIPIHYRVMVKVEDHAELMHEIGKLAEKSVESIACNGIKYAIENMSIVPDAIDKDLHYYAKLVVKQSEEMEEEPEEDREDDSWDSHEFGTN